MLNIAEVLSPPQLSALTIEIFNSNVRLKYISCKNIQGLKHTINYLKTVIGVLLSDRAVRVFAAAVNNVRFCAKVAHEYLNAPSQSKKRHTCVH